MEDITHRIAALEDLPKAAPVLPIGEDNGDAADAYEALERTYVQGESLEVRGRDGPAVQLAPEMAKLVADIVRLAGLGSMATVIPRDTPLTPRQASSTSGFQQEYIHKVLTTGELRSVDVDGQQMVRYRDLVEFKDAYHRRAREGMKLIRHLGQLEEQAAYENHAARRGPSLHGGT